MKEAGSIWVFNGVQANFPSGIFSARELAEAWILKYRLTGTLTEYPLDVGMYDYSISKGFFTPKKEEHQTSLFIGKFTDGGMQHFHFEDGLLG